MPPGPMRYRVAGTDNPEWFHVSGKITCDIYEAALSSIGRSLASFGTCSTSAAASAGCSAGSRR